MSSKKMQFSKIRRRMIPTSEPDSIAITVAPANAPKKKPVQKTKGEQEVFVGGQDATVKFVQSRALTNSMANINGVQTMVVEKTEAIDTINMSLASFVCASRPFFPQSSSLPWLSSISGAFTEYQVLELEYTYVPSVPTTQAGNVMFAFTGDYNDSLPTTQPEFLQTEQALLAPAYAGGAGGRALQRFGFPSGDVVGFSVPKYTYTLGTSTIPNTYRIVSSTTFTTANNVEKNTLSPGTLIYAANGIAQPATPGVLCGQIFVRYKVRLLGSVAAARNV